MPVRLIILSVFVAVFAALALVAPAQQIVVLDDNKFKIANGAGPTVLPTTIYPDAVVGITEVLTYRIFNQSAIPLTISSVSTWGPGAVTMAYTESPASEVEPFSSTIGILRVNAHTAGSHNIQVIIESNSITDPTFTMNLRCVATNEPVLRPDLDMRFETNLRTKLNRRSGLLDIQVKGLATNYGTAASSDDLILFYVTDKNYFDDTAVPVGAVPLKPLGLPKKPGKPPKGKKVNFKLSTDITKGHVYMLLVPGGIADSDWQSNLVSMFYSFTP